MTKKAWAFENSAKFCFYSRERERERERERLTHKKKGEGVGRRRLVI